MTMPNPAAKSVISDPDEVAATLAAMDLSIDVLTDSANAGEQAAVRATAAHPRTAAGLNRWIETVGTARDHLADRGPWLIDDPQNRPLAVHTSGNGLALAFASGDSLTGHQDLKPNVARKKGRATTGSYAQLTIPFTLPPSNNHAPAARGPWIFLYYRGEHELRMEVSLPTMFDQGRVVDWHQRIILPPLTFDVAEPLPRDAGNTDVEFVLEPRDA